MSLAVASCVGGASPSEAGSSARRVGGGPRASRDPLPAWSDGPARRAIVRFVTDAVDPHSPAYVPREQRVAVFDNDGTLWCERPMPPQAEYIAEQLRRRAAVDPARADEPIYRAALAHDASALARMSPRELVAAALEVDAGLTVDAYAERVRAFLSAARHPRFGVAYTARAYQPMLELLAFVRAHGFRAFIVTGGEVEFVRVFAPALYGIAREAVAGTNVAYELRRDGDRVTLVRSASLDGPVDDGPGKPPTLQRQIGQRPALAVGNSDGDLEMLEYAGGARPALRVLVHHDDAAREYAYDAGATRALAAARRGGDGWVVVSMREDFRRVFATDPPAVARAPGP